MFLITYPNEVSTYTWGRSPGGAPSRFIWQARLRGQLRAFIFLSPAGGGVADVHAAIAFPSEQGNEKSLRQVTLLGAS